MAVAEPAFLVWGGGGGGQAPEMDRQKYMYLYCASASETYFQDSNYNQLQLQTHLQSMQFPLLIILLMVWRYKRHYTDKTLKSMNVRANGASELRKFSHFHIHSSIWITNDCIHCSLPSKLTKLAKRGIWHCHLQWTYMMQEWYQRKDDELLFTYSPHSNIKMNWL